MSARTALAALVLLLPFRGAPLTAAPPQDPGGGPPSAAVPQGLADDGWNSSRVLELVDRGRRTRRDLAADGDLETYQALTEGHIYFYLDPEVGERALIRVDQIAVELRWASPDHVQQNIVGERSETRLPVREFRYYLDRLTLVEHGFGDEIRVGSGLDVAGVPHPLAPLPEEAARTGEAGPYDFRMADSLSISLPGRPDPVRIYELDVRPRDPEAPGIMGRILLDQESASIVRMAFTFTPASYVDRRTDRISVEMDYGLWENQYWLPNLQAIEVRRELPELDLGVGTVIRAVLRVSDYELNVELPEAFWDAPPVTARPETQRQEYDFVEGLFDGLERDGLAELVIDADPRELRDQARESLEGRRPSGLSPARFHLPRASSAVRYNRVEGLFLGFGGSLHQRADLRARTHGGYALEEERVRGALSLELLLNERWHVEGRFRLEELDDLGLAPGIDPLLSSLSAAFRGEDYRDPYRVTDAEARIVHTRPGGGTTSASLAFERHRSATLGVTASPFDADRQFRGVRQIADGHFVRASLGARLGFGWPGGGRGRGEARTLLRTGDTGSGLALETSAEGRWGPASGTHEVKLLLTGWGWWGDALPQGHRLAGGRGTLPGYSYRSFGGERLAVASLVASSDAVGPFLRVRGGLHSGWADGGRGAIATEWESRGTEGIALSASLGVGLLWDLIRVDVARGTASARGGEWQLLLSLDPRWWDRL